MVIYVVNMFFNLEEAYGLGGKFTKWLPSNAVIKRYCKVKFFSFCVQVRRTVAALVGVAQGKITLNDIKLMLEIPSLNSWYDQLRVVPAHGLYLCEVGYTNEDFNTFRITSDE